jgi:hypothetical protein
MVGVLGVLGVLRGGWSIVGGGLILALNFRLRYIVSSMCDRVSPTAESKEKREKAAKESGLESKRFDLCDYLPPTYIYGKGGESLSSCFLNKNLFRFFFSFFFVFFALFIFSLKLSKNVKHQLTIFMKSNPTFSGITMIK